MLATSSTTWACWPTEGVYGVKTSPYIVREQGPLVTAWTLLMSMQTGQPLLLCDAGELTTARTAATTAVAVDALAPLKAQRLAIIGSGKVAQAHLHYVKGLRDWQSISLYSPSLSGKNAEALAPLRALDPRLTLVDSREAAVQDADVILLCTSSAGPVIDPSELSKPALITSISTNAPRAHEVPPQSLNDMQVFCDYRLTTPGSAGEMLIAGEQHGWDKGADCRRPARSAQRKSPASGLRPSRVLPLHRPGPGRHCAGQCHLPPAALTPSPLWERGLLAKNDNAVGLTDRGDRFREQVGSPPARPYRKLDFAHYRRRS